MRPSDQAVSIPKSMPAVIVYKAAGKAGEMDPTIRTLVPDLHMAGPAFSLRTRPGDNLGVFSPLTRRRREVCW